MQEQTTITEKLEQDIIQILEETRSTWDKVLAMDDKIANQLYQDDTYKPKVVTINEDSEYFVIEIWYTNYLFMPPVIKEKVLDSINDLQLGVVTEMKWGSSYSMSGPSVYLRLFYNRSTGKLERLMGNESESESDAIGGYDER